MDAVRKLINYIHLFTVSFAKILLLFMVLLISAQVFCRYVLGFSIMWSEEVALLMMIWFGFISLAIGVKRRLHISIQLFTDFLPEHLKKIVFKLNDLVMLGFGLVMIIYGIKLVHVTMSSTLPATGFPSATLYAVIPVSGILVVYDTFMDFLGLDKLDEEIKEILAEGGKKDA